MKYETKIRACKIIMLGILVMLLLLVRALEGFLFYDPFTQYFEGEYLTKAFPSYEGLRLFMGLSLRYLINTLLSLGVLYVLFSDKKLLVFTSLLYLVLFAILVTVFFALLEFTGPENNFAIFYIRRFLIQPLFILLFVPAFYYQSRLLKK